MPGPLQNRPRRRKLIARPSVRVLMALILILSSWLGWVTNRARQQSRAVAVISRAGGHARYDLGRNEVAAPPDGPCSLPAWLVRVVGIDHFYYVVAIHAGDGSYFTDVEMAAVGTFERLEILNSSAGHVTDAGLAHLARLTRLNSLSLVGPGVTDAGLAHLRDLVELRSLSLIDSQVSGSGLAHLQGLARLESLCLDGSRVRDLGVLRHLARLENLYLSRTPVTDEDLAALVVHFPHLELIKLDDTAIGNPGLAHLARLTRLEYLSLNGTQVGDDGLNQLAGLSLVDLELDRTTVRDPARWGLSERRRSGMISLRSTRLDDAGLLGLAGQTWCPDFLHIGGTMVTAKGEMLARAVHPRLQLGRSN
jgi:internalin A